MRRRLVRHPGRDASDRPVGLWNDDQFRAAVGVLPDDRHSLAAPGMERIADPPLDRLLAGSMSLFEQHLNDADFGAALQQMCSSWNLI